ncbi:unnamed protein product [Didymodactylos carnosus]|uniref:HMG box domain-containing protein n=1 Tax=Didymodactylos carnosus TaxID=1234261 RepID=A0A813U3M2_9BILA|nr:unnamed protein product [Didymodactylos carnosus]CAF0817916.1 unnamed protein product [Didymodactylos carnosus]CAF3539692.1 unnamed protein product [Didymodactylos carnosus]CAF3604163.1 unnamed protein product [Didymodactylos carnosus]
MNLSGKVSSAGASRSRKINPAVSEKKNIHASESRKISASKRKTVSGSRTNPSTTSSTRKQTHEHSKTRSKSQAHKKLSNVIDDSTPTVVDGTKKKNKKQGSSSGSTGKVNAYQIYMKDIRPKVVHEFPGMKPTEITKEIGARWRALSDSEKGALYKAVGREMPAKKAPKRSRSRKSTAQKKTRRGKKGNKSGKDHQSVGNRNPLGTTQQKTDPIQHSIAVKPVNITKAETPGVHTTTTNNRIIATAAENADKSGKMTINKSE